MPNYKTPGVYVEEVPSGARSIEAVSTSTACFIGTGGKPDAPIGEPTAITNWTQYMTQFMGEGAMTPLSHAVNGFFTNTQGRCYILDIGPDGTLSGTADSPGLSVLEAIDDISIIAAPDYTTPADYEALISHCETMHDRFAILDPPDVTDIMALTRVATQELSQPAGEGQPGAAPGAAGAPGAPPGPAGGGPAPGAPGAPGAPPPRGPRPLEAGAPPPTDRAALYYPKVRVVDLNTGQTVAAPPSGHMAGIYARVDATIGVHKAPANEPIRGIVGLEKRVAPSEQGELNEAGVNVLRTFEGLGNRVWGARTLARSVKPEMRYINVRRLFTMAEKSIERGTSWCVFQPNDRELWSMMVRELRAFLTGLWRDGALMGRTPEEAFIVKCDDETNPRDSIDRGLVVAYIWLAPVKPAEFVVFKVSQYAGGTTIEEGSFRA